MFASPERSGGLTNFTYPRSDSGAERNTSGFFPGPFILRVIIDTFLVYVSIFPKADWLEQIKNKEEINWQEGSKQ